METYIYVLRFQSQIGSVGGFIVLRGLVQATNGPGGQQRVEPSLKLDGSEQTDFPVHPFL